MEADATSFPFSATQNTECIASSTTGCRRQPPPQLNRRPTSALPAHTTRPFHPIKNTICPDATYKRHPKTALAPPTHPHSANNSVL
jgi:hypothetical protein